jgi:hypothetical protein
MFSLMAKIKISWANANAFLCTAKHGVLNTGEILQKV